MTLIVVYKTFDQIIFNNSHYLGLDDLIFSLYIYPLFQLDLVYINFFKIVFYIIELSLYYFILKTNKINKVSKLIIFIILIAIIYPDIDTYKIGV